MRELRLLGPRGLGIRRPAGPADPRASGCAGSSDVPASPRIGRCCSSARGRGRSVVPGGSNLLPSRAHPSDRGSARLRDPELVAGWLADRLRRRRSGRWCTPIGRDERRRLGRPHVRDRRARYVNAVLWHTEGIDETDGPVPHLFGPARGRGVQHRRSSTARRGSGRADVVRGSRFTVLRARDGGRNRGTPRRAGSARLRRARRTLYISEFTRIACSSSIRLGTCRRRRSRSAPSFSGDGGPAADAEPDAVRVASRSTRSASSRSPTITTT